jgi:hypothetical protein
MSISEEFTFFHSENAGQPDAYFTLFGKSGWTFEPKDWEGDIYAPVYDTLEEAKKAAEKALKLEYYEEQ